MLTFPEMSDFPSESETKFNSIKSFVVTIGLKEILSCCPPIILYHPFYFCDICTWLYNTKENNNGNKAINRINRNILLFIDITFK